MNIFCFYLYSPSDMYILAVTLYQDRMIFADFSVNSKLTSICHLPCNKILEFF